MASLFRRLSAPPGCDSRSGAIESLLDDLQTVAVGITSKKSFGETELILGNSGDAGRNDPSDAAVEFSECLFGIGSPERCLPVPDIIGARVFWRSAAISRRKIFEELDSGTTRCAQTADP